jgi:diguanylate cyclase (GGDEF)-like protein
MEDSLILIVEDNYTNIQHLGKLLTDEGYDAAVAVNGQKALEFLKEKKPDLVLLDVMLPDMNGYELCARIAEDPENTHMPIIFLSARSEKEDVIKGLKLGAVDYIIRPCNPLELMARIRTHLELKKLREKYYNLSIKDDLTGLYNRRFFIESLKQEIERFRRYGNPFTLALMDIDDFKETNDTHGHIEGDRVLRDLSDMLQKSIRKTDIAGRFGGDEFALLFPETPAEQAMQLMERIASVLRERERPIYLSIGVTECISGMDLNEEHDIETVIGRADRALYQVKRNGKNNLSKSSD